jgi:putative MFS transporter
MVKEGFTDLRHGAMFVSATFVGMMIGAFAAGYVGDRLGRRYSYQLNLGIFGLASIAACFAPNIEWLIALRFIMGVGLGAELVVAAGTLAEFVPPATRGKWVSLLAIIINSGLFAALAAGYWIIPNLGWRYMFAVAGVGALVVWFLRHRMPESPRWLESVGKLDEAEATLISIEREVEAQVGKLPPVQRVVDLNVGVTSFRTLFVPGMRGRTCVAALTAIAVNIGFTALSPGFPRSSSLKDCR